MAIKRPRPRKPPKPKSTKGNVYRQGPGGAAAINNPWMWGKPGNIYRSGKVPKPKPRTTPRPPAAPAGPPAPTGPPDPYAAYADNPWAVDQFRALDREQANHQQYVTGQVAPWLSQALTNLTGIDPNAPGLNTVMQQQYLANVSGAVGGALNAAATATPMNPMSTTPGGIVASPDAYLSQAARDGAAGRMSGAIQAAQVQSALNTMQPNTQAQGYVYALADYAKGLPTVYANKRAELRSNIDQYIAEQKQAAAEFAMDQAKFAETQRHNRVSEAISATNSQTNAAIQLGRLGLSAADQAFDNQPDPTVGAPAPTGYIRDVDGSLRRDPTYVNPSSGGGSGGGGNKPLSASQISSMNGKWKRPRSSPPKLGAGWKQPVWDPKTKAWYAKRASGSGKTVKPPENLRQELDTFYFSKVDGKFEAPAASRRVGNWILARKKRFTRKDGTVNVDAIAVLLKDVIGGAAVPQGVRAFLNPYIVNGRWR